MKTSRRNFLSTTIAAGAAACIPPVIQMKQGVRERYSRLDEILRKPVLNNSHFSDPVIIKKVELLRYKDSFLCRVESEKGETGISVSNDMQMISLYPILINRVKPFFLGKDARELEKILDGLYVYQSNYKLQNLALWVCVATVEFAVLDLLGQISGKSIGELIGTIHNREIAVYQANGDRGISARRTIENMLREVEESKAKAVKFKVGGRMSNDFESPAGRTEELIPLVRKTFGDKMVCYADSNGSYTPGEAIRIGKILEEYKMDFYEEPVPFDWYEETLEVASALKIPIAGGEQEPSMHMFRWLIANEALRIVQPDMFYFGGMIRSMKVARMAELFGLQCTPHISGSGLGYLYMMHFVSSIPNAGPFHEFKGPNQDLPFTCTTSTLQSTDGVVVTPSGPGIGIEIEKDHLAKYKVII